MSNEGGAAIMRDRILRLSRVANGHEFTAMNVTQDLSGEGTDSSAVQEHLRTLTNFGAITRSADKTVHGRVVYKLKTITPLRWSWRKHSNEALGI